MKLNKDITRLICDLEYCVGKECFNPNSYDGYTGEEGCEFRYPVYIRVSKKDEELEKAWANLAEKYPHADTSSIGTIKYKFGSNHLFIGLGIKNILERLEELYDLDFNELEKKRKSRK